MSHWIHHEPGVREIVEREVAKAEQRRDCICPSSEGFRIRAACCPIHGANA